MLSYLHLAAPLTIMLVSDRHSRGTNGLVHLSFSEAFCTRDQEIYLSDVHDRQMFEAISISSNAAVQLVLAV